MWDLVGVGAGGCQLGVQGLKGAAGPVGAGAAATEVPGVGGLGPAVEGHLSNREKEFTCESQQVRGRGLLEGRHQEVGPSLTLWRGSLLSRGT